MVYIFTVTFINGTSTVDFRTPAHDLQKAWEQFMRHYPKNRLLSVAGINVSSEKRKF